MTNLNNNKDNPTAITKRTNYKVCPITYEASKISQSKILDETKRSADAIIKGYTIKSL